MSLRFTTHIYPKEQRLDAWRFALKRVSITFQNSDDDAPYGELIQFKSSAGISFVRLTGTAQEYVLDFRDNPADFWLLIMLDGKGERLDKDKTYLLNDGDLLCGAGSAPAALRFATEQRVLLVQIPEGVLDQRLKSHVPTTPRRISGEHGPTRMLASMLRSLADIASDLTQEDLRPVELALPEFLLPCLLEGASTRALGGGAGMRAALLERVSQTIEMRLSDPELNYQQIAGEHGISPRYLQKLFESINDSFGHYVKVRRLERCRLDLTSPLHAQKSISDILFQWGFNDSASFSRAFREQYGISPREYRKRPTGAEPADNSESLPQRGRPATGKGQFRRDEVPVAEDDCEEEVVPVPSFAEGFQRMVRHHHLPANPRTVHWGYFSKALKPALTVKSGDYVTIETLTHHANDDAERMVHGDDAVESIYHWDECGKTINRRGAGPLNASAVGRGAGEGFGVHICTGPIAVEGARPGDVLEVRIISLEPRQSRNPQFEGKAFGSNAATFWGFHYGDLLTEPKNREVVTIYEVETGNARIPVARAVYNYRWTPQTDPSGRVHQRYDYPGVAIDPATIERNYDILRDVEIPVRPHFGVIAVASDHSGLVDSIPPSAFGGNLDNWRAGPRASVFLPVQVEGGLLSLGDPHASQGDSELCGTAIECSMTAMIQVICHPASKQADGLRDLDYPLIETDSEWVIMGFSNPDYLRALGDDAQSEVYKKASLETAMRDAFRKARRFLMTTKKLTEDEAISLLSVGVDFGVTQVVNGNWGVHAVIRKNMFLS